MLAGTETALGSPTIFPVPPGHTTRILLPAALAAGSSQQGTVEFQSMGKEVLYAPCRYDPEENPLSISLLSPSPSASQMPRA